MFISNGAGFNTNGVTCLDWLEPSKIKSLPSEYIKNSHEVVGLNQLYPKSLKSPLNQSGSKIITDSNKLQSSSAENTKTRHEEENAKTDKINSSEKLGTPDTLKSSEVHCISSVDTAEGTFLNRNPIPTNLKPSAVTPIHKEVVNSLEDAIVDRVYAKPEMDTVIMREFVSRGFQMPEIHKVLKESSKIHKYKQGGNLMIAYKGVRADEDMDVGV